MSEPRPLLVLARPATDDDGRAALERVRQLLEGVAPHGVEVRTPGSDQAYADAVASVAEPSPRDVVVLGGDGSVHRLLQELHDQQVTGSTVGLVPAGTGNDLARSVHLPLEAQDSAPVAVHGRPAPRGLLVDDTGGVVVNAVHAGVAAEATVHAGEVKGIFGKAAYAVGALRAGLTSRGWHLRLVVDGRTVVDGSRPVLMVTLALGSSVGGGARVAPDARPDDGLVDVVVARGTSPVARLGFARDLRRGRHTARSDVTVTRGREVLVEAVGPKDAFHLSADGEVSPARISRRSWRVEPGAWRLRVPDRAATPPRSDERG
ncbi:diacylglycerol/lipid kinase family protein [Ornithinimicrobium avium]|uniref:diacylglycerol/lipid kinase family protein n=1 Tax=Ornithinimicrobium avium TaxID=2283195 RepID=UPI0013B3994F|nr:diacylglycerol kinase family protein [Ornithinimicrobium avium]